MFVVANVASVGQGPAVMPAQARTLIKHARTALLYPSGAILEQDVMTTVTAPGRRTSASEVHEWLSTSPPFDNRELVIRDGKVVWDQATVNSRLDLYDPGTNTAYLAPASAPHLVPNDPNVTSALSEVRYLLGRSGVTVNPNVSVDGMPAIEFTFDGGRFRYWASANDYQPLQSEDRLDPVPGGGTGDSIDRYPIDRVLTGAFAPSSLLSVQAQHPGATIDRNSADYRAALRRLIPGAAG